jgi:ABC-type amino acid transport substrate-binding protein
MRLAWFVMAISVALLTPAAANRLDEVKARGKLIVGVSDTTSPFFFKKPGESINLGYDIDMVRAVAKRMGVAVETASLSSAERIPLIQQGKIDFAATSCARRQARPFARRPAVAGIPAASCNRRPSSRVTNLFSEVNEALTVCDVADMKAARDHRLHTVPVSMSADDSSFFRTDGRADANFHK